MTTFDDLVDPAPVALWVRPSRTPDGGTFAPWTDGSAVGFVIRYPNGETEYAVLRPGASDGPWPRSVVLHRESGLPPVKPFFSPPRDDTIGPVEALRCSACRSTSPLCEDDRHRLDDGPEPGYRCKDCGHNLTWRGPDSDDWDLSCHH